MNAYICLLIVMATIYISYLGFRSADIFNKYEFEIDKILTLRQYKRLISAGFLHLNWTHLLLNMYVLLSFGSSVEAILGGGKFLLIYFLSLIGGNVLSLFLHRNDSSYTAIGASGAVAGIIFAVIAIMPQMPISFLLMPFSLPAWLWGILYFAYCVYGIKSLNDNVGHDAHLGGALVGLLLTPFINPYNTPTNYWFVALLTIIPITFIIIVILKPEWLYIRGFSFKRVNVYRNIDDREKDKSYEEEKQIDRILDKISKKGIESLTTKEKQMLENISKR